MYVHVEMSCNVNRVFVSRGYKTQPARPAGPSEELWIPIMLASATLISSCSASSHSFSSTGELQAKVNVRLCAQKDGAWRAQPPRPAEAGRRDGPRAQAS